MRNSGMTNKDMLINLTTDVAVIKNEMKNIGEHLKQLNGKVAEHEREIKTNSLKLAKIIGTTGVVTAVFTSVVVVIIQSVIWWRNNNGKKRRSYS